MGDGQGPVGGVWFDLLFLVWFIGSILVFFYVCKKIKNLEMKLWSTNF